MSDQKVKTTGESEEEMKARYVNPFTDFGFKKLFGEKASKESLIDFLNTLLPIENKVKDLTFADKEKLGDLPVCRDAVYDIFCEDEAGKHFIVEMQNASQRYFKDRAIFYSTFPIREQAEKGNWNYQLKPVYCIAILGFEFGEEELPGYIHEVNLKNQNDNIFYEKLTYIFIELPKFKKKESELENRFEKWLYFIKNLEDFEQIPEILNEKIFKKAFLTAEIANFDQRELKAYERSLKSFRDNINIIRTALDEGREKGRQQGIKEGIKEGKNQELINTVKVLLKEKFNLKCLDQKVIQQIENTSNINLKKIRKNIFNMKTFQELEDYL